MIKEYTKRILKKIFEKRSIYTQAAIYQLAPSDLLKDRCAIITGGAGGIGFCIADAMLKAGAFVCITGRNESKLEAAVQRLSSDQSGDCKVFYEVMDNQNVESFNLHLENIRTKLGDRPISILVNNAGTLGGNGKTLIEDYNNVLDINLRGTYFLSQALAKYMINHNIEGNILNIGSSSSNRPATSAYSLSKWGIKGLTLGMAKSLISHNIVVNGIAPGPTATPMLLGDNCDNIFLEKNPLKRYTMPEEIANMAVFLTSNLGKTIIGSLIYMTGGAGVITYDDIDYHFPMN